MRFGLLLCLLIGVGASAKGGPPPDPLHRDSPQSAVVNFLEACRKHDYQQARSYLDLRKLPPGQRAQQGVQLSQQLQQILEHSAQFDVADISTNPAGQPLGAGRETVDSFTVGGKKIDLQLERVPLRSGVSIWLFSAESVALIPQLARLASNSPIEKYLPDVLVERRLVDTAWWRWIALALLAAALAALSRLVSRLALSTIEPVMQRAFPRLNTSRLEVFAGPLRLLVAVAGFRAGMEWITPSATLRLYLERGVTFLLLSGLAWVCMKVVDLIILRLREALHAKHQGFAYSVLPLTARVTKIIILFFTAAAVLSNWGYNTTTILAGLGLGGVAIALAAQKTIENLFGGVAVITDRPVNVGDFCKFGDRVGTVEDIGLRSTRIRSLDRTLITVPNGQFSSMTLENFSKRDKVWFHLMLNLRRDTTTEQVRTLLQSVTRTLAEHPKVETGPVPVRFVGIGTYSLDLEVFAYIATNNGDEFLRIQQELLLRILEEVEAAGTALALPTQAYYSVGGAPSSNGGPAPQAAAPRHR